LCTARPGVVLVDAWAGCFDRNDYGEGRAMSTIEEPAAEAETAPGDDGDDTSGTSTDLAELAYTIATYVEKQSERWRDSLAVGIGRARELTGLDEARIRYFEQLGALHPAKTAVSPAANRGSRSYTLADLRCLAALAMLVNEKNLKPALAAAIVREHRHLFTHGVPGSLGDVLRQESNVVADGFLLARLVSQLLDAARAVLDKQPALDHSPVEVVGVLLPTREQLARHGALTEATVQEIGEALVATPENLLVAVERTVLDTEDDQLWPSLDQHGRDDTTVIFRSHERWEIAQFAGCRYCFYRTGPDCDNVMILVLRNAQGAAPALLAPDSCARRTVLDRLLTLCAALADVFGGSTAAKNYRYRSDGFQLRHTRRTYNAMLERVRDLLRPGDEQAMAVLMIPDNLDQPSHLIILAHHGYDPQLARRARLGLLGGGQGLCGRAYLAREPFYVLHAEQDTRVAYAVEEECRSAIAVPLTTSWGLRPFGVFYLATKSAIPISTEEAYTALILGSILSELLGRWWLTRLRRGQDALLHQQTENVTRWLESLDPHGPRFDAAVERLVAIRRRARQCDEETSACRVALVLFDVDRYRERVQARDSAIVPLKAQTHVHEAIQAIVRSEEIYWFKHDHALLVLDGKYADEAVDLVRRVSAQVRNVPLDLFDEVGHWLSITVSSAIKILTYRDLRDMTADEQRFVAQIRLVLDDLREQTSQAGTGIVKQSVQQGWQEQVLA
jgi:hypothetical protein